MQGSDSLRWDDVRLFLAALRAGTLAGASQTLAVDASTVSRRLAAMEKQLGVLLFDRSRDGLAPTSAAELLRDAAEQMERGALSLAEAAGGIEREVEGKVHITAAPGLMQLFVVPSLPRLLTRHAGLRVELSSTSRVVSLSRREADLALRTVRSLGADLVQKRIARTRYRVVTSPAMARDVGKVTSWDQLRFITWGEDLAHIPLAAWHTKHTTSPPVLRTNDLACQIQAAARGVGVALLPDTPVTSVNLVPLELSPARRADLDSLPAEDLFLVTTRALRQVPRVSATWDFLLDEAFR